MIMHKLPLYKAYKNALAACSQRPFNTDSKSCEH